MNCAGLIDDCAECNRDKAQHAARRKMQSQPYSQQAINENEALILQMAGRLSQRILDGAGASPSGTIDVYPFCGLFSFEVICKTGFNKDVSANSSDEGFLFLKAMDDSAKLLPINAAFPFLKKFGLGQYVPGFIGHTFRRFSLWERLTRELYWGFQIIRREIARNDLWGCRFLPGKMRSLSGC